MKHLTTQNTVLSLVAASALFASSCQSSLDRIEDYETPAEQGSLTDVRLARAPEGFTFETTQASAFAISTAASPNAPGRAGISVSLFALSAKDSLVKIAEGITDASGTWSPTLSLPSDIDSITLRTSAVGLPQTHRVAVAKTGSTRYAIGADNGNGRVVADDIVDQSDWDYSGVEDIDGGDTGLAGRATLKYMGAYDKLGVPAYLTSRGEVWPDVLDFIATNLPEQSVGQHHPEYLNAKYSSTLRFTSAAEVWITFVHEGAGYRNAVGYFFFDLKKEPKSIKEVPQLTIAYPNTSFQGSGGGLAIGDRIFLGKVPANTGVCLFLIPDGWNEKRQRVDNKKNTRYTIDALNTFAKDPNRKHAMLLANSPRETLVLGFEDLNRPGGDNDFNDAVFLIEPKPWSSVDISSTPKPTIKPSDQDGDGVADYQDAFPFDKLRAFTTFAPAEDEYGTLAYEDMWPRTGDYDFNDLVVDYNITEVLAADNRIKDLRIQLSLRALGATQNHGFAFHLPVAADLVEKVTGQDLSGNTYMKLNGNGTEEGLKTAVIPAFVNSWQVLNTRFGLINTDPDKPAQKAYQQELVITFKTPIDREKLGRPPYDAFMIRSQDRSIEIHLAGYAPTDKADRDLFNTDADKSDPATGYWYVDKNNLPWGVHLPASFRYPKEKKRIDEVYTNFVEWAVFGGNAQQGWWRDKGGNVDSGNAY